MHYCIYYYLVSWYHIISRIQYQYVTIYAFLHNCIYNVFRQFADVSLDNTLKVCYSIVKESKLKHTKYIWIMWEGLW